MFRILWDPSWASREPYLTEITVMVHKHLSCARSVVGSVILNLWCVCVCVCTVRRVENCFYTTYISTSKFCIFECISRLIKVINIDKCCILSFGWFPGVRIWNSDVSEDSTVFQNTGTYNSGAEESPKRKNTTFRTRWKFDIKDIWWGLPRNVTQHHNMACDGTVKCGKCIF
jgi:hypothetical protein